MKKKNNKAPERLKKIARRSAPGSTPGQFSFDTGKEARLLLRSYNTDELIEFSPGNLEEARTRMERYPGHQHWLQVTGLGNSAFLLQFKEFFGIHSLELEDVQNGTSRPKLEYFHNHFFQVSRVMFYDAEKRLVTEQLSSFLFENLTITFQEEPMAFLNPVIERMKDKATLLRKSPVFYLYYAINDAVIDNYFPLIAFIETELEKIEDILFNTPERKLQVEIQGFRRDLLYLRKTILAEKDNISELKRSIPAAKNEQFGIYLQDAYEHCIGIIDIIESQKEICFSLMDIYLSSQNNRLGEAMKVLTVISSIFIPLSFVAGVYGMNFSPVTKDGRENPLSMPELYEPYGYVAVIGVMLIIATGQIIFFKRKGWI